MEGVFILLNNNNLLIYTWVDIVIVSVRAQCVFKNRHSVIIIIIIVVTCKFERGPGKWIVIVHLSSPKRKRQAMWGGSILFERWPWRKQGSAKHRLDGGVPLSRNELLYLMRQRLRYWEVGQSYASVMDMSHLLIWQELCNVRLKFLRRCRPGSRIINGAEKGHGRGIRPIKKSSFISTVYVYKRQSLNQSTRNATHNPSTNANLIQQAFACLLS